MKHIEKVSKRDDSRTSSSDLNTSNLNDSRLIEALVEKQVNKILEQKAAEKEIIKVADVKMEINENPAEVTSTEQDDDVIIFTQCEEIIHIKDED